MSLGWGYGEAARPEQRFGRRRRSVAEFWSADYADGKFELLDHSAPLARRGLRRCLLVKLAPVRALGAERCQSVISGKK